MKARIRKMLSSVSVELHEDPMALPDQRVCVLLHDMTIATGRTVREALEAAQELIQHFDLHDPAKKSK